MEALVSTGIARLLANTLSNQEQQFWAVGIVHFRMRSDMQRNTFCLSDLIQSPVKTNEDGTGLY